MQRGSGNSPAPCNIGRVFNLDAITMLDVLYEIERLGKIKINRTAGLDVIHILDNSTIEQFDAKLQQYKSTAESYHAQTTQTNSEQETNYHVTFVDADGNATTKSFERIEATKRGKLLYNQITQALDSMGHAISEQEKRQILMDVLKNLC